VAVPRHYINIIWHYGWHSLQSQMADYYIANLMYISSKTCILEMLRAAASNAYSSLAVPGQMPKCTGWCQFRYYYYYYCCWSDCWIYYPLRIDNRPIIFVLGRSFRFFLHSYSCFPARRPSSERIILLLIVYIFCFSFYELS
jgi:hypothetical protein